MKPHEFTAGITDEALGPRFDVVPFDLDYPDVGECVYCGYRSSYPDLIRTVHKDQPGVVVMRCVDSQTCIRRRPRRENVQTYPACEPTPPFTGDGSEVPF